MSEFLDFHGTTFVVQYHWIWMLVALGLGIWVGWHTARGQED